MVFVSPLYIKVSVSYDCIVKCVILITVGMRKVYFEGMVGKYLTNLNRNKTACAYIINNTLEVFEKIQCLKLSAR